MATAFQLEYFPSPVCEECGEPVIGKTKKTRFCSKKCQTRNYTRKSRIKANRRTGQGQFYAVLYGAISETRVENDLLKKKYLIALPRIPFLSGDIIALKDGKFSLIEVRTGWYLIKSGALRCAAYGRLLKAIERGVIHHLAIVTPDDQVHYVPPLPNDDSASLEAPGSTIAPQG
jgi:hypothetical protein